VKHYSSIAATAGVAHLRGTRPIVAALAMSLAATTAMAAAALVTQTYKFRSFAYPGAASTDGRGINNSGQIVGQWQDSARVAHGFLLSDGVYRSFDVPGALGTYPQDINDAGTVVGLYTQWPEKVLYDANGERVCCASYGFVRTPDGQFLTVDYPTTNSEIPITWLFGINNVGRMVGGYNEFELAVPNTSSHGIHSFVFDGAAFTPIDFPSTVARVHIPVTYAVDVNDAGNIVGGYNDDTEYQSRHGFVLRNGVYSTFDMPAADFTDLFDINNFGEIIGESSRCASYAFLYSPKRGFSCITGTPITKPKIVPSLAFGMNDAGELVGGTGDGSQMAFLATPPPAKR
jgi:uncharacterized membrane protein